MEGQEQKQQNRDSSKTMNSTLFAFLGGLVIDLRSLAVARILMGIVLVGNILTRISDLTFFYTDMGGFPKDLVMASDEQRFSLLFLLDDSERSVYILFTSWLLAAILFTLGYRTFWANLWLWIMDLSVQNRVPFINNRGDHIQCLFLFWILFLPSGRFLSLDARKNKNKLTETTVLSGGSVAFVLQLFCIYFFTAMLKTGEDWKSGEAVWYALSYDRFLKEPVAGWLRQYEIVWRSLGHITLLWEWVGALLLFVPYYYARVLVIILFLGMHAGFFFTMYLGYFPAVCAVYWISLLPGSVFSRFIQLEDGKTRDARNFDSPSTDRKRFLRILLCDGVPLLLMISIVIPYNLASLKYPTLHEFQKKVARPLNLDQRWSMFAPKIKGLPDGWFLMPALLSNGNGTEEIELLSDHLGNLWGDGNSPVAWADDKEMQEWDPKTRDPEQTPESDDTFWFRSTFFRLSRIKPPAVQAFKRHTRWRKLMLTVPLQNEALNQAFGEGICNMWNNQYQEHTLRKWELVFMLHYDQGPGKPPTEVVPRLVWKQECPLVVSSQDMKKKGDSLRFTRDENNSTECSTKQLPKEYLGMSILDLLDRSLLEDPTLLKEAARHLQEGHLVVLQDAFQVEFAESVWSIMTDPSFDWEPFSVKSQSGYNYNKHVPVQRCKNSTAGVDQIFRHPDSRNFIAKLLYGDGLPPFDGRIDMEKYNLDGDIRVLPSWYRPGDYHNPHDDRRENRVLTYLWQLTKDWKPEWGGAFYWANAHTTNAFQHPGFNTLILFAVTPHSIHGVTPVTQASEGHKRLTYSGRFQKKPRTMSWEDPLEEIYGTPKARRRLTKNEAISLCRLSVDGLDEERKQHALNLQEKVLDECLVPREEKEIYTIGYMEEGDTENLLGDV